MPLSVAPTRAAPLSWLRPAVPRELPPEMSSFVGYIDNPGQEVVDARACSTSPPRSTTSSRTASHSSRQALVSGDGLYMLDAEAAGAAMALDCGHATHRMFSLRRAQPGPHGKGNARLRSTV